MNKVFEFYWADYEDYRPRLFCHQDKSDAEFVADCKKAMTESFSDYFATETNEKNSRWLSIPDWIEYAYKKLQEYGYKAIKPIAFGYTGGYLPKSEDREYQKDDDWFGDFPDEAKQIMAYNQEMDKEMYKDLYAKHGEVA